MSCHPPLRPCTSTPWRWPCPPASSAAPPAIGRLTAEALAAASPPPRTGAIAALRLAPQQVAPHWSDRRIADALADAIRRQLDQPRQ